jgi:ribosomal protein S1
MRAHEAAKRGAVAVPKKASKEASAPMPVPKAPPPGVRLAPKVAKSEAPRPEQSRTVNDVLAFLSFVEKHPVGSKVKGVVDSYSAHGAYIAVGEVKAYAPLRLLGSPPPRSAREAVKIGDPISLVVAGYTPSRRSVEVGVPEAVKVEPVVVAKKSTKTSSAEKKTIEKKTIEKKIVEKKTVDKKPAAKKAAEKKAVEKKAAEKKLVEKKTTEKKSAAKKAPVKQTVEKKAAEKKPVEKKTAAKKAK